MILADTSIWIDHLRGRPVLEDHLYEEEVLMHPFVAGELACGSLHSRNRFLTYLASLPLARTATSSEVIHFIEIRRFWGLGLGWVDVNLLVSALITPCRFKTADKRLAAVAHELGLD